MQKLLNRLKADDNGAILARGALGALVVKIIGAAIAFALHLFMARLLGVIQYGIYVYTLTFVNILAVISMFGLNNSLVRFAAAYKAQQKWGLLRGIFRRSTQVVTVFSSLNSLIGIIVVLYLQDHFSRDQLITFYMAAVLLPIFSLAKLQEVGLRAFKQVVKSGILLMIIRPSLLAALLISLYIYLHKPIFATHAMIVHIITIIMTFAIGRLWLAKALPQPKQEITPIYEDNKWLMVSLPLLFIDGTYMLLGRIDIIMVGSILGSEEAGVYSVASRISGLVTFGLLAANTIVAPLISELHSLKKNDELQRIITLFARGVFIFNLTACIGLIAASKYILAMFGKNFVAGYLPLLILLIGRLASSLSGPVEYLMVMTSHQNKAGMIVIISTIASITLNGLLIPLMGMIGAAIATAFTIILWNITMLYYVHRRLGINPTIFGRCRT